MTRFPPIVAIAVLCAAHLAAETAHSAQYVIYVKLEQQSGAGYTPTTVYTPKTLAAPKLATPEGVEFFLLVGGQKEIAGEKLQFGTMIKGSLQSTKDGKVLFKGIVEKSDISNATDESATRTSTAIHFKRTFELGKVTRFEFPDPAGGRQSLELKIVEANHLNDPNLDKRSLKFPRR